MVPRWASTGAATYEGGRERIDVPPQIGSASEGWLPPGGYEGVTQWALDNRGPLEAYAQGIE